MEGKVLRMQEINNPWVTGGVTVQSFGRTMKNAICALLDEGADGFSLVCGDVGIIS